MSVFSAQGEAFAKKKVVEPVATDSLTLLIQAGDSLMQQYNTFEALRYYQQAFAMKDTLESRTKLADCYYKRANYRQTADLLKTVDAGELSHEAFRELALSYQKMGENEAFQPTGERHHLRHEILPKGHHEHPGKPGAG